ncbi:c-type cytochrome biogenesis protein CcmI [Tepidicaulis sp. LMO-SS28]|uniref:c-type cytochrome biogenesis protein CcmI n=1 Tax=Tepidicaulis sp. LMO-SS28 TaxID=3447455 RepID=UPI003EE2417B
MSELYSNGWALWPLLAVLTGVTLIFLLRPLRRADLSAGGAPETEIYREQLAELDADVARGALQETDAAALRREISRRLIAAADAAEQQNGSRPLSLRALKAAGFALVAGVSALTLGLYLWLGKPGMPDMPQQARLEKPLGELSVDALVIRLEKRLRDNPEDARGWQIIGPVYTQMGRYEDAIDAFGRYMMLEGRDPDALAGLAEALTLASDGVVVAPARRAFEAALELEADQPQARFYMGLAKAQDGDVKAALADWEALEAETPEGAPWAPMLEAAIAAARRRVEADAPPSEN